MSDRIELIAEIIVAICVAFTVLTLAIDRHRDTMPRNPRCIHIWRRRHRVRITEWASTQRRYCRKCSHHWWPMRLIIRNARHPSS